MLAEVPRNMANAFARSNNVTVGNRDVALLHTIRVGRGPISDIDVDAHTVVVTNFGDNSIAVLDPDTLVLHGGVFAGQPTTVAVADDRAFVAVSSAGYDAIAVIDTNNGDVIREYPLAFNVTVVVASSDGKRIYAGRAGDDGVDVVVIDVAAERVGTIYIAKGADATIDALRLDASGRRLFVAVSDARSSRLLTVDVESSRVRRTLEIGAAIRGLEIGVDGSAYVLTSDIADGGVLYFVDLVNNKITGTVRVAEAPTQLALSVDGTRAYVVDYGHVAIVDTDGRSIVSTVSVGARPSAIAVSVDRLYIADYDGGVSAYAVETPTPMLYSQFVAAPSLVAPAIRELAPAGV
jgi:DNA-binding beta-propeller fold protein YncE